MPVVHEEIDLPVEERVLDEPLDDRSPASMSAVTISPRPWSHECSVSSPTSAFGSAYEPCTANVSGSSCSQYG